MLFGKTINKYLIKYWYLFLLGILALLAVDYAQLFEPEFLGQIVDSLSSGNADPSFIGGLCLKLLLIAAVVFTGRMVWRFALFGASQRIEAGIRSEMFDKSLRLSQNYYQRSKTGSIMSWFTTDIETIEEFMSLGTVQLIDTVFMGVLVIIRMLTLDWVMTLFALVPMSLIAVWGALVEKFMTIKWRERQERYDKLYDFTQEIFTGISVIKAFVRETSEIHAFAKAAKKNRDANVSYYKVSLFFDLIIEVIIGIILALIIGFGSFFVYSFISGTPVTVFGHVINMTPGSFVTFTGYFDTLIWPMIAFGFQISMLSRAKASLKRINEFLGSEEDVVDSGDAQKLENVRGSIEFRGASFAYPSAPDRKVLEDITLRIEPGELIGVVGRVGSGKTTLMTLLCRLYNLPAGTVFIDGRDIMDCSIASVRSSVAFVPQESFLFSGSVGDNISFASDGSSIDEIREAARFADLADSVDAFPDGLDTDVGERGSSLSGGQKQRVAIARAYIADAPIMVLDDSVSAVDVRTEEHILESIREKRAGRTTVIIASRVSTVSRADRIIVLKDGKLEAFDTPERLLETSPTYKKMVYLQELEREVESYSSKKGGGRRE